MQILTEKSVLLKSGETIPSGAPVTFLPQSWSRCLVQGARSEPYRVRVTSVFNCPSMDELEESANDGVCQSIAGETVEPDGYDEHGSPSWLLALDMI